MELNCKISPALDNLAKYNQQYSWIPGPENIRPNPETLILKNKIFRDLRAFYTTNYDYILSSIFDIDTSLTSEGKLQAKTPDKKEFRFVKNIFPYQLPDNTNHYIMWYTFTPSDDVINQNIYDEIFKLLDHKNFQFVWYENPKMNIPGLYHVQVFWIHS